MWVRNFECGWILNYMLITVIFYVCLIWDGGCKFAWISGLPMFKRTSILVLAHLGRKSGGLVLKAMSKGLSTRLPLMPRMILPLLWWFMVMVLLKVSSSGILMLLPVVLGSSLLINLGEPFWSWIYIVVEYLEFSKIALSYPKFW